MIIKDKSNIRRTSLKVVKWAAALIALALLSAFVVYPLIVKKLSVSDASVIFCDAEEVWQGQFLSNGRYFKNGFTQSDKAAYSGKYSSLLSKGEGNQWGFGTELRSVKKGETYEVSVWRKMEGEGLASLVFTGEAGSGFYKGVSEATKKGKAGWEQILFTVKIPNHYRANKISVYVYTDGKANTYFDDLQIKRIEEGSNVETAAFKAQHLAIELSDKGYLTLQKKRKEAYEKGLLITDEDSWVKGSIVEDEERIPIKMRLKGDWLDHLSNKKWSFRIKVKDPNSWNRMLTFSVQTPSARYYAMEWLLHQFWEHEDVLTTRYDFITLSLRDEPLGIYAYEEHFEKQLVESKNRREGPILRFVEDGLWDARLRQIKAGQLKDSQNPEIADMAHAEIKPFKENKILASEPLRKQYEIAHVLMYNYQQGKTSPSEIFDLEKMAKYNAIADLLGGYHSLVWHNQRFYYNPVIGKLEPIGFDGYSNKPRRDPLLLGKSMIENGSPSDVEAMKRLYEDEAFVALYMKYLYRYTSKDFLEDFFDEIDEGLEQRLAFLKNEFSDFSFNKANIFKRAEHIRYLMLPYDKHSIKSAWVTKDGIKLLQISNIHAMPLEVIGSSRQSSSISNPFERSVHLPAFRMGTPRKTQDIKVPTNDRFVFYKPYGIDTLFSAPIGNWKMETVSIPSESLFANINLSDNAIYEVKGDKIYFRKGEHQIKKDIIIPAGYEIYFQEGTRLDFIQKAKFIARSPVFMNGTGDQPIYILSSDRTANGFSILQATKPSSLFNVIFDGFNTLNYQGWTLTGAVTFYESDVTIKNSVFKRNPCEDGLNIIRSKFMLDEVIINETFSDGFDADFCEGTILNSHFIKTGNDGVDVSGSQITIEQCTFENCGDKGISVGEESKVNVTYATIDGAVIGTASKDMSYLSIEDISLKNCNQGFAAYQKKPEFGPSTIIVKDYSANEVKYLHTIAPRCTLELKNHVIVGE